ncbi:MAG: hypothetical protein E7552_03630 [Ruminococcaceae bacterium]|nr:hypothetical protein [Oscillospiraceae bacterium]
MKVGDWVVLAATWLAALGLGLAFLLGGKGGMAVVTTPTETVTLPLSHDTVRTFTGRDGMAVTITVADGAVRFASSECPDRVCVHSGALSRRGACAACVPAGITVTVAATGGGVDAIAD